MIVSLGEVAREYKNTIESSGKNVVGLEHLDPENIFLTKFQTDVDTTFTKEFKKNQILFGRRRAYLKKACVAPFDGVCSGDIIVIEPKNNKIDEKLLPFLIQNDDLFNFAMKNSAGSLSPRVKWSSLEKYKFILPDIESQQKLSSILWKIEYLTQSYEKLIDKYDELIKSQFIEIVEKKDYDKKKIQELTTKITDGSHNPPNGISSHSEYKMLSSQNIINDSINYDNAKYLTKEEFEKENKRTDLKRGDVLLTIVGTVGRTAIVNDETNITLQRSVAVLKPSDEIRSEFLVQALKSDLVIDQLDKGAKGIAQKGIYLNNLKNIVIPVPPLEVQNHFITLEKTINKSKFELQKNLDLLKKAKKSLINENFIINGG